MKYFFIVLTVMMCGAVAKGQTAEDSVKSVINNMFTGMKNADPVLLKSCFADSMVLQTISRNKEGMLVVRNEAPSGFIDFVSKEEKTTPVYVETKPVTVTEQPIAKNYDPAEVRNKKTREK